MLKKYENVSDYTSDPKSSVESQVSLIEASQEVMIDGVNVRTETPCAGDAVYHDGVQPVFFKGGAQLNHALLVEKGFTPVGDVLGVIGDDVLIRDKNSSSQQYCACVQWAITAISSTSITLNIPMAGNYGTALAIPITLTSTSIDETTASEIDAAINAAGNSGNVGYDKHKWWAFLANDANEKVTSDGTRIVVQCDISADYRQFYQVSASGATISLVLWEDMPASTAALRKNGVSSYYGGFSYDKFYAYYSVSGATPTANVSVTSADPVNKNSFDNSAYCEALRNAYGTYENYIRMNMINFDQPDYGVFSLPSGKELTLKYALKTFVTKGGTTSYKFPFFYYCYNRSYNVPGLQLGDFFAPGVEEGMIMMDDDVRALVAPTATKMGNSVISNSVYRWFAQRCSANRAWVFDGGNGTLNSYDVYYAFLAQAVSLWRMKH